jgi:hypothetical protein
MHLFELFLPACDRSGINASALGSRKFELTEVVFGR